MFHRQLLPVVLVVFLTFASVADAAAFLGVAIAPPADEQTEGVTVAHVAPESPADKSGLKAEDVITKANDKDISDVEALIQAIQSMKPGDKVKLVVQRDGEQMELTPTLGEGPERPFRRPLPRRPMIGIAVAPAEPEDALRGYDVLPNSPANAAEIKVGDVLAAIDGKPLKSFRSLLDHIASKKAGDKVVLKIKRDGEELEKTVELARIEPRD